jgi:phage protein D
MRTPFKNVYLGYLPQYRPTITNSPRAVKLENFKKNAIDLYGEDGYRDLYVGKANQTRLWQDLYGSEVLPPEGGEYIDEYRAAPIDFSKTTDVSDFVTSIDYEDTISKDTNLTIKISGIHARTVCDNPLCTEGNGVVVQFGFLGETSKTMQLYIMDIDFDYLDSGTHLILRCCDTGKDMKMFSSDKVWKKGTQLESILQDLGRKHSLKIKTDDISKVALTSDYPQGNLSDFEFIQELADRSKDGVNGAKYISYVSNGTLYYVKKSYDSESTRTFTLEQDIIYSFKIHKRTSTKKGGGTETALGYTDPDGKLLDDETAGDYGGNVDVGNGGKRPATTSSIANNTETLVGDKYKGNAFDAEGNWMAHTGLDDKGNPIWYQKYPMPSKNNEEAKAVAESLQSEEKDKKQVCILEIEGDVDREVNTIITIKNAAKRHSGKWYIQGVRHKVDTAFKTTLDLSRNATDDGVGEGNRNEEPETENPTYQATVYDAADGHIPVASKLSNGQYVRPRIVNKNDATAYPTFGGL